MNEAAEIIRSLIENIKRTETQWEMSRAYSAAVQWLKRYDDSQKTSGH